MDTAMDSDGSSDRDSGDEGFGSGGGGVIQGAQWTRQEVNKPLIHFLCDEKNFFFVFVPHAGILPFSFFLAHEQMSGTNTIGIGKWEKRHEVLARGYNVSSILFSLFNSGVAMFTIVLLFQGGRTKVDYHTHFSRLMEILSLFLLC